MNRRKNNEWKNKVLLRDLFEKFNLKDMTVSEVALEFAGDEM